MFSSQFNQVFGSFGELVFWTAVLASLLILGLYLFSLRQISKTQTDRAQRNSRLAELTVLTIFGLALLNLPGLIVIIAPGSVVDFENNWLNFTPWLLGLVAVILILSAGLSKVKK
jgi:uncharacterized membrane protein